MRPEAGACIRRTVGGERRRAEARPAAAPGNTWSVRIVLPARAVLFLCGIAAASGPFSYDDRNEVLGRVGTYRVQGGESLYEIARMYKTGFGAIVAANLGVDAIIPEQGTTLALPTSWLLPDAGRARGMSSRCQR